MRTKLLALLLLTGSSLLAETHIHIGVNFGGYGYPYVRPAPVVVYTPPPPVPVAVVPAAPARGYVWVAGYWYPSGRHYNWRPGRWVRPRHARDRWVAPRYRHGRYYRGYWRR